MSVPDAVQKQADLSDKLMDEHIAAQNAEPETPTAVAEPVAPVPEATPAVTTTEFPVVFGKPTPASPGPVAGELERLRKENAQFRQSQTAADQRNASLKGMIDKQRVDFEAQIAAIGAKVAAAPKVPEVPAHLRHLTPEERELLKDEPEGIEARMAKGIAEAEAAKANAGGNEKITALEAEIAQIRGQGQRSQEEKFFAAVDEHSPGASQINKSDPRWDQFLNLPDPDSTTGAFYRDRGEYLMNLGDVKGIAALMDAFKKEVGIDVNLRVEAQLKPATAGNPDNAGAPGGGAQKPVWKRSQVALFYSKKQRDSAFAASKEAKSLEADIDSAQEDGRIIDG